VNATSGGLAIQLLDYEEWIRLHHLARDMEQRRDRETYDYCHFWQVEGWLVIWKEDGLVSLKNMKRTERFGVWEQVPAIPYPVRRAWSCLSESTGRHLEQEIWTLDGYIGNEHS
jgi:hypothetical protein